MSDRNEVPTRLTRRQKRALRLLTESNAPNDVARELGISLRKLWNWRRLPQFQEGLAISARELDADCKLLQKQALAQALATLIKLMRSKRALPRTVEQSRLEAARLVFTAWSRRGDDFKTHDTQNGPSDVYLTSPKPLSKKERKRIRVMMEFLDATRDLVPTRDRSAATL